MRAFLFALGICFFFATNAKADLKKLVYKDVVNTTIMQPGPQDGVFDTAINAKRTKAYFLACIPGQYGQATSILRTQDVKIDRDGNYKLEGWGDTIAIGSDLFLPCAFKAALLSGAAVNPAVIRVYKIGGLVSYIDVSKK